MRDAGAKREIALRDTERLVGAIGLAPGRDFLAFDSDNSRDAAALVHRPAQPIERRRIGVMDSQCPGSAAGSRGHAISWDWAKAMASVKRGVDWSGMAR